MIIKSFGASSSGNCHMISDGVTALLLDAGIPFKQLQVAMGFNLSSVQGVLLTHEHMDHAKSVKDLMKRGITVYSSAGTFDALGVYSHRAKVVKPLEGVLAGSMSVLPIEAEHDAREPLGFVVTSTVTNEKLLYLTDSFYCKFDVRGLTHMIVECNYCEELLCASEVDRVLKARIRMSHMSLETLEIMLRSMDKSKLQKICLTHLSDRHSDEAMIKDRVQRLTGVEVEIFT